MIASRARRSRTVTVRRMKPAGSLERCAVAGAVLHRRGRAYETRLGARSTLPAAPPAGIEPAHRISETRAGSVHGGNCWYHRRESNPANRFRRPVLSSRQTVACLVRARASRRGESNPGLSLTKRPCPPGSLRRRLRWTRWELNPRRTACKAALHPDGRPVLSCPRLESNQLLSIFNRALAPAELQGQSAARTGVEPVSLDRQSSCDTDRITSHAGVNDGSRTRASRVTIWRAAVALRPPSSVQRESNSHVSLIERALYR